MPRGGRGGRGKVNHKGQRRHFSDVDELKQQEEKLAKEKAWRRQHGIESDEETEDAAATEEKAKKETGTPGELPPSGSDSEESSDDEVARPKGVEHLIEIENPNRAAKKSSRKVTEINAAEGSVLTRREREELEKQEAKRRYQQLHIEGKTDEARADLARLALIRKQREEAAKKREEERLIAEKKAAEKKKT
ncbi:28 kDa heat- and acid-stable phosphoprotein-like [Gigantopelta aegis]|uniref:28 kDa heat- and acid-stable phosphoprotein-like n=1 Tax=Gigantopelta aegis TaxID=1735272 RepID=UPI001B8895A9|nr:28 kDa heat- and acid-stable phosphoprotein-like [Gigantopelta aegis]